MKLSFTVQFKEKLGNIKKTHPKTYRNIEQKLKMFKQNPNYPSLRTHKLKGNLQNTWSISVDRNFRLIYFYDDQYIVFFYLGSHDEVYKK